MFVYADNAATTKPSQVALDAMLPCLTDVYGNPSSLHSVGQKAAETASGGARDRRSLSRLSGARNLLHLRRQ